jgi:hypothetical protein
VQLPLVLVTWDLQQQMQPRHCMQLCHLALIWQALLTQHPSFKLQQQLQLLATHPLRAQAWQCPLA